jgi:hypothetical protein
MLSYFGVDLFSQSGIRHVALQFEYCLYAILKAQLIGAAGAGMSPANYSLRDWECFEPFDQPYVVLVAWGVGIHLVVG